MADVVSPRAVLSYPQLFEPRAFNDQDPKYSATLLIDKDHPGLEKLREEVNKAADKKWPNKKPRSIKSPFLDGDDERYGPECRGKIIIRCSAKEDRKPKVFDAMKKEVTDPREVYPGMIVRAIIRAYGYDVSGNAGVSFGLGDVQILGKGTRIDGGLRGADAFDAVEMEDDDQDEDSLGGLY